MSLVALSGVSLFAAFSSRFRGHLVQARCALCPGQARYPLAFQATLRRRKPRRGLSGAVSTYTVFPTAPAGRRRAREMRKFQFDPHRDVERLQAGTFFTGGPQGRPPLRAPFGGLKWRFARDIPPKMAPKWPTRVNSPEVFPPKQRPTANRMCFARGIPSNWPRNGPNRPTSPRHFLKSGLSGQTRFFPQGVPPKWPTVVPKCQIACGISSKQGYSGQKKAFRPRHLNCWWGGDQFGKKSSATCSLPALRALQVFAAASLDQLMEGQH